MRLRPLTAISVLAFLILLTSGVHAQTKPDFSGKWTLVPDPVAPGGRGGPVGRGVELVVTQDEKTLTVNSKLRPDSEAPTPSSVYRLDGSESKNESGSVSKVRWEGSKLVISTTWDTPAGRREKIETWQFSGQDQLLISLTNYAVANPNTAAIYKKSR